MRGGAGWGLTLSGSERGFVQKGFFGAGARDLHGRPRAAGRGPSFLGSAEGPTRTRRRTATPPLASDSAGPLPQPTPKRKNPYPPFVRAEQRGACAGREREEGARCQRWSCASRSAAVENPRCSHASRSAAVENPRCSHASRSATAETCRTACMLHALRAWTVCARQSGRAALRVPINFADPVSPPLPSSASAPKGPEGLRAFGSGQAAEAGPPKAFKHG